MHVKLLKPANFLTVALILVMLCLWLRIKSTTDLSTYDNKYEINDNEDKSAAFEVRLFSNRSSSARFPCDDITPVKQTKSKGNYWVLYNYITATKSFQCDESITYTTNADFTFLDNVIPIVKRWGGPISLSVYAPGSDFKETLTRIAYLRKCLQVSYLVKEFVTFHIFFERAHLPESVMDFDPSKLSPDCSASQSSLFGKDVPTYKKSKNLTYPINMGRNIARDMATTHYVFASDIELYPNPNLIQMFLEMVERQTSLVTSTKPHVFVLSVFEIEESATIPTTKKALLQMLKDGTAIPFHKNMCKYCHTIPNADDWRKDEGDNELHIFHSAKRHKPHDRWEPFYIGTKADPPFDDRLTWEGKGNKMTQGYLMCVMDYDFLILDNAFLIHRPGIKKKSDIRRPPDEKIQSRFIWDVIKPEYDVIYGSRKGCVIL